ncbi:MAG: radical SAM protein [Nitrospinae bacterium]|nr:radical SAM protein [Nitrospinota bacterium]
MIAVKTISHSIENETLLRPVKVLLVYPNTADVALDNLGFQRVHSLLNQIDGVDCDRFSLPLDWKPEMESLQPKQLLSHEWGWRPLDFDMIAFSISFEPDYLHVAALLKYFGIPLESKHRGAGHPLILAGGSAVFINPEPIADIVDVFFIGEGEGLVGNFFDLYLKTPWDDSRDLLHQAAIQPGIYVPRFYHPQYENGEFAGFQVEPALPLRIKRYWTEKVEDLCTHSEIHNGASTFKDMALMEVTRGCIWACRFCTAGFIYRPPRLPDLERTYQSLEKSLAKAGHSASTIGFVGPSVTDHPDLVGLAKKITAQGKKLSFSSLRMETLTDELVDLILQSGQKTLTVAVDAPSERMRDVVNKAATDEFIIEKCRFLTEKGILHLKIYSIIGLPGEEDEDIDQFITLVQNVMDGYVDACRKRGNIGNVTIGLSPLIPKPGTPFQWHPMERVKSLKKKFMKVRKALGKIPHLKMSFGSPNEAYLQTYLSRGDRRLLDFFKTYLNNHHDAKAALNEYREHVDAVAYRQFGRDDFLPWDIVDHGYKNHFLWQDYQRGLRQKHTPICDTATCKICGLC